jgi:small subunit ribosomal protein S9
MTEAKKTTAKKPAAKKATATKTVKTVKAAAKTAPKAVAADVKLNNATYATGKRKDSVARVYLLPGKGNISVNGIAMTEYFRRPVLQMIIAQPFGVTKRETEYDVVAKVMGGGMSGQAVSVKHGISKAL